MANKCEAIQCILEQQYNTIKSLTMAKNIKTEEMGHGKDGDQGKLIYCWKQRLLIHSLCKKV